MLSQPPFWFILLAFVLAIGPLVFIHEMGHYLVARWFGIGAETFSIGFGREIAGWTDRRGTRWKVGWLPLGGYVKFVGDMTASSQPADDDTLAPAERSRAFHLRPVWQRFLVVLAGPVANFLLAIAILAGFLAVLGMPFSSPTVQKVDAGSAAASAGLRPGDRITAIGGSEVESFEEISRFVMLRPGKSVDIAIERDGRAMLLGARIGDQTRRDRFGQEYRIGRLGIQQKLEYVRPSALELIPEATKLTFAVTGMMIEGLQQIIMGDRSVKELGGPIKMAQVAGQQASLGWEDFVQLIAFFSINLGFINLLPVPTLDGGHLAMYGIEAVRRRPLAPAAQEWAFRGGFALLLTLILFLTANDLASLGLGERLGQLIG